MEFGLARECVDRRAFLSTFQRIYYAGALIEMQDFREDMCLRLCSVREWASRDCIRFRWMKNARFFEFTTVTLPRSVWYFSRFQSLSSVIVLDPPWSRLTFIVCSRESTRVVTSALCVYFCTSARLRQRTCSVSGDNPITEVIVIRISVGFSTIYAKNRRGVSTHENVFVYGSERLRERPCERFMPK